MSALRQEMLKKWLIDLKEFEFDPASLQPASSDASFRRYFRVHSAAKQATYVVMDAPTEHEDVRPFVAVAKALRSGGTLAPEVFACDADRGFLLLEDFGNTTFLQGVQNQPDLGDAFYLHALDRLVNIQANTATQGLLPYGPDKLMQEMNLFDQWYVGRHFGASLTQQESEWLQSIKGMLIQSAMSEPQVFVHRDYHSRNLMVLNSAGESPSFGVLDFQDAVVGPLSYDVVSLLRDAYIEWPEPQTLDWVIRYWEMAKKAGLPIHHDVSEFYRQLDFMGLQRHLKVLGIFARLNHRDGKSQYLNDLPLVLRYVRLVAGRYIAFKPLLLLLDRLENKVAKVGFTF